MITKALIQELEQESQSTRRVLERLPADQLEWRPHPKSMSLGQLGLHVAGTPGAIADLMTMDEVGLPEFGNNPQPGSKSEILDTFEESIEKAKRILAELGDDGAMETWRVVHEGQEIMAMPKVGLARSIMLNHWYHHRGQLLVYLRLLDLPVPAVYGDSADEHPILDALGEG